MKRILVISYSQSGQLNQILDNFLKPFETLEIDRVQINPEKPYVFPWTSAVFFDTMPESVLEEPVQLAPFHLDAPQYDLIILGYQPWYLSPSIPTTSLLQDDKFLSILKNTPVVTVIGARNMWLNAQESVVQQIQDAGGQIVANVPLIDKHQNLISALTILHWMLTAKKERKWGILPYPGVSSQDIAGADTFGQVVYDAFQKGTYDGLQDQILAQNKIAINPSILLIEMRAKSLFRAWAKLIKRKGTDDKKRAFWVGVYKYYLLIALFIISPIVLTFYTLFVRPFIGSKIKKNTTYYLYLGIKH
ncbi:hypothetical protein [Aureispira anguillae]|uniref:Dialkylrecorsinol condensing enzyme n=1 Tax=Aureispira anguillae TaxID=2864201 RepID=A0A915YJ64_9BACT|nr:hypothetical protein [Aureispira anguillae]BDS13984.1 hypothetical protein AsAng_0047470 [Aureispira anguillae]